MEILMLLMLACAALSAVFFYIWSQMRKESESRAFSWLILAAVMLLLAAYSGRAILRTAQEQTEERLEVLFDLD